MAEEDMAEEDMAEGADTEVVGDSMEAAGDFTGEAAVASAPAVAVHIEVVAGADDRLAIQAVAPHRR